MTDEFPDLTIQEPPRTVIEAIAAIMQEIPGIGRDNRSEQGYNYRGIESITRHLQPLLGKYGVVFVPKVLARFTKDLTINSKPWTEEQLTVEYTVFGPGGLDDCFTVGPIIGLGRDNSDKGSNKALTQAYKYALIQTFCIGDAKDDADQHKAAEADAPQLSVVDRAKVRAGELEGAARTAFGRFLIAAEVPTNSAKWTDDNAATLHAWFDHFAKTGEVANDPESLADALKTDEARTPPQVPTDDSGAPEQESLPVAAPEPESVPGPDLGERMAALVKAMKPAEVKQRLQDRDISTDGTPDQLRNKLTLALVRDEIGGEA